MSPRPLPATAPGSGGSRLALSPLAGRQSWGLSLKAKDFEAAEKTADSDLKMIGM
jgi:hypothetical protein